MIQGQYEREDGVEEEVYCGMKRRQKKHFKRNKKEYSRLADHIGLIPLIMVSPADSELISGGSEERRRFMDVLISQVDKGYLDALMRYNNALLQRNTLLKQEAEPDPELLSIWEEMMVTNGEVVYQKRAAFIQEFIPIFQSFYAYISKEGEEVSLVYESQLLTRNFAQSLRDHREKDRIMGYSLVGVHKDNLDMQLGGFPIKREGSQGQNKTYLIALKLAQFEFLKRTGSRTTPLLLLDDIFDKLDASRVEQIVKLVSGNSFGQIFITDTNREHLDRILERNDLHYKLFEVTQGEVVERRRSSELASAEEGGENHEME
jgi:DNA replication and repair protein RecF